MFITDEGCCPLSGQTFKQWTGALLDVKADVKNLLIINTKCDVQDLGRKLNVNDNCVVSINDITRLDSWWSHVIKFAFEPKGQGDQGISVSVNSKHGENTNFKDMIIRFMNHFQTMESEKECQIIINDDLTAASKYENEVQPQTYMFSFKDMHLEGKRPFGIRKTFYGQDETLTLLLHILTDVGAVLATRDNFQQAVQNSARECSIPFWNNFGRLRKLICGLLVFCPILIMFYQLFRKLF